MALAQDTPVILMDEPTTYLDISHQLRVMELVRRLAAEGKAVLLVLHDLLLALQNADYIGVMDDGKVVHAGSTEDIYESKILDKVFGIKVCRMKIDDRWKYYYE